jgi:hypothetical protein
VAYPTPPTRAPAAAGGRVQACLAVMDG